VFLPLLNPFILLIGSPLCQILHLPTEQLLLNRGGIVETGLLLRSQPL
jgi:hypothetical protein